MESLYYGISAVFASERKWATNQKITDIEGGVRFEFTSSQFDKVLRWILANGSSVVPREPKRLVEEWKSKINEMQKVALGKGR